MDKTGLRQSNRSAMSFIKFEGRIINLEEVQYIEKDNASGIRIYYNSREYSKTIEYTSSMKRDEAFEILEKLIRPKTKT